jgi:hypothetical protein
MATGDSVETLNTQSCVQMGNGCCCKCCNCPYRNWQPVVNPPYPFYPYTPVYPYPGYSGSTDQWR